MADDPRRKFFDLLSDFDTAMLITRAGERIMARPMAIADVEESCRLWFITAEGSEKEEEILSDSHVSVTCQKDHSAYLHIAGKGSISRDRARIQAVWREPFQVWFPKGVEDPNITLISVTPEEGEYWDNRGFNRIKYIFEAISAYATGKTPSVHEGEQHAKSRL